MVQKSDPGDFMGFCRGNEESYKRGQGEIREWEKA